MTTGVWKQIQIAGKTVDLYEPARPHADRRAALHLHGHGGTTLYENPVYTAELEKHGLWCICPHGARSWWGKRICSEFDPTLSPVSYLIDHLLPTLKSDYALESPRIALTGISMGGQGALRLSYWYPRIFPVVVGIAPAVDYYRWVGQGLGLPLDEMYATAESARQESATLELHPLNWPRNQYILCDPADTEWIDSSERLISKLRSMGIPYESDLQTSNGGHCWEYFNQVAPQVMKFVAEKLEEEAHRL